MVTPPSARWLVVIIGFLALSLAFSARSTLGLMMPYWGSEFGWSRGFLSTGGAAALILMAVVAPIVGNTVDRYGARSLLVVGMIVTAAGMMLLSAMSEQWMFILAFSGVAALGFGIVAMHVIATAVAPLFDRRRGLATGIATAGATAGQLLIIPLFTVVVTTVGWRSSYMALALACVLIAALFWTLLPARDRRQSAQARADEEEPPITGRLLHLLRTPVFHALFWPFALCGFTTAGVIETHLLPYASICGFAPLTSATAFGALSAFNMIGMIIAGYLSDRMNRPLLLAAIYFMRAGAFVLLMYIANDISLLFIFAAMFGLFDYSTVPVTANLVASHLGMRIMGLAMGVLATGHALGGAAGAFLGGYLFDLFARYGELWTASIGLAIVAGLITLTIREHRRDAETEETATETDGGLALPLAKQG